CPRWPQRGPPHLRIHRCGVRSVMGCRVPGRNRTGSAKIPARRGFCEVLRLRRYKRRRISLCVLIRTLVKTGCGKNATKSGQGMRSFVLSLAATLAFAGVAFAQAPEVLRGSSTTIRKKAAEPAKHAAVQHAAAVQKTAAVQHAAAVQHPVQHTA